MAAFNPSLKISIESLNYKLLIKDREDRELHLCTTFIEEKEIITFKIESLNRNTKLDFKVSYQSNKENEAKEWADSIEAIYWETSAKTNDGIYEPYEGIVK